MNSLLIYNDNIGSKLFLDFGEQLGDVFQFEIGSQEAISEHFNVDEKIDDILKTKLEQKEYDAIFLPYSLSKENYLEFLGLRFAMHIRLTKEFNNRLTPIIFFGRESALEINRLSELGSILFTRNVFQTDKISIADFKKQVEFVKSNTTKDGGFDKDFFQKVVVRSSGNYESHHSIANEWSLVRYFSMLKFDEDNRYKALKDKISALQYVKTLHYKYTEAFASREPFNPKKHTHTPQLSGLEAKNVGVIDDEYKKGWLAFYDYLLGKSGGKVCPFEAYNSDDTRELLIEKVKRWINSEFEAKTTIDIFIVDLRLHDDDFREKDFNELSGVQVIKHIKKINPGIQIVVSSASNKIWTFKECLALGVDSYAIKESPETYNTRFESKMALSSFARQIESAAEKIILAETYRRISAIKAIKTSASPPFAEPFSSLVFPPNGLLDQIQNLLLLNPNENAIINQCLILCFQVLENYCDLKRVGEFGTESSTGLKLSSGYVWLKTNTKKDIFINQPNQKILTWFELTYGRFPFQMSGSNDTPVSFNVFDEAKLTSSYHSGLEATLLVKLISVLFFRDGISKPDVERIINLRYYRSNVAAHFTGNVQNTYKINCSDILFLINTIEKALRE